MRAERVERYQSERAPRGEAIDARRLLAQVLVLERGRGRAADAVLNTYAVPPALAERLRPGQLVSVPFGARAAMGIVWDLGETAPEIDMVQVEVDEAPAGAPLRAIDALRHEEPLLSGERMALAEWLADHYVCSLAAAVGLMLPPGLLRETRVVVRLADTTDVAHRVDVTEGRADAGASSDADSEQMPEADAGDGLSPGLSDEMALLGALRAGRRLDEGALRRALGATRARAAIAALLATGAVTRESVLPRALTGRRSQVWLRLAGGGEALTAWRAQAREALDRLAPLSEAGGLRTAALPRGQGERRAERVLRQLAVLDVLERPHREHDTPAERDAWPLSEVRRLTRVTSAALDELAQAGLVEIETAELRHDPLGGRVITPDQPWPLSPAQEAALAAILAPAAGDEANVVLLHGVTGSGKTEVYLQALAAHLAAGRRGIVLVPEIALTPQAMLRFAGRFPGRVALLHSGLTDAERLDEWRRIQAGQVDVVVGSRSALFAPIRRLGLIVVDEEHEMAYKQSERQPTYHARDTAVQLGRLTGATVVLGSATPSVESHWQARRGAYRLVEMAERVPAAGRDAAAGLPSVTIVDLRAELRAGNTSILGRALQAALAETLDAGEQAILFLNRRGTASSVICRECGYVALCGRCDVPMTFHASERALICHYCGWRRPAPQICPHCWGASIRYFGIGTERVEAGVKRRFPQAHVLRWDRDTARTRQAHEELLAAFAERRADVLVGTQMIAKGLDLPGVTLVGVVSADIALYLPDFRASERAFQLLTQVAGRAGRGQAPGRVIVQTFNPDYFCIQAAARHDYHAFYEAEAIARERYGYPPFRQFAKLTYTHRDRYQAQVEATALADRLEQLIREAGLDGTDVVGPAPAFMERLRGRYRWQLIARGPDVRPLLRALSAEGLPRGWTMDVDPVSML